MASKFSSLFVSFTYLSLGLASRALAQPPAPRTSVAVSRAALFSQLKNEFWDVEWRIHPRAPERNGMHSTLPLERSDRAAYAQSLARAARFLKTPQPSGASDEQRATALFIAAMSASTLEHHAEAVIFLTSLLQEFPQYTIPRMEDDTHWNRPASFDLAHLLLYHQSRLLDKAPKKSLETLRVLTSIARQSVQDESAWDESVKRDIAAHTSPDSRLLAESTWQQMNNFYTPEQARAANLPPVAALLGSIFAALMPSALQQSGVGEVRKFLNEAAQPDQPFVVLAKFHLGELDKVLIAQLQRDAAQAEAAAQWDKAQGVYVRLITDFPDNPVAAWAQEKLAALKTRLVRLYLDQAKPLMKLPGQQYAAAKPFYEKALAQDPNNGEALLGLAQTYKGLGDEANSLRTLDKLIQLNPQSISVATAKHEKAMTMRWYHTNPEEILRLFQEASQVEGFEKRDEAMYFAMIMQWKLQRHAEALKTLQEFLVEYPNSPYHKWAEKDLPLLLNRIEEVKAGINLHPTTGFNSP